MRNTVEYPITAKEIIDCLDAFLKEVDPDKTGLVGDMRTLLLEKAKQIILNYEDVP